MMEQKFLDYFESLGMKKPFINRINHLMEIASVIYPDAPIVDVIVSEYLLKSGERVFDRIRLYTEKVCITIPNFLTEDTFSIAPLSMKKWLLSC